MTKRNLFFLFCIVCVGVSLLLRKETIPEVTNSKSLTPKTIPVSASPSIIPNREPAAKESDTSHAKAFNTPSKEWEKNLEEHLRLQGGNRIKEIKIEKVDSFVWKGAGVPLNVQSAIVTLKSDKNAETTFRVLVDAQTGKILQNWDQPIFDPANPRSDFRVKIDPRYHVE